MDNSNEDWGNGWDDSSNKGKQEGKSWHLWRSQGLGSSEIAAILGVSQWKTAYQLWEEKAYPDLDAVHETSYILEKGKRLEPIVREMYWFNSNDPYEPALCQMENYSFMRASLDGRSVDGKSIIEIKYVGKSDHALAKEGKVPDKYMPQIQHQLLVTGAEVCHYLSFDETTLLVVDVYPDLDWQTRILGACIAFWTLVESRTPPALVDADHKLCRAPGALALSRAIELQAEKLMGMMKHDRMRCSNLWLFRDENKNLRIDFKRKLSHDSSQGDGDDAKRLAEETRVDLSESK